MSHANLSSLDFSTKATCRHVEAPSCAVLSYDMAVNTSPSSGNWFHCLHATSHALHPMHTVVSVKNPTGSPALVVTVSSGLGGCWRSTPWTPGSTHWGRRR